MECLFTVILLLIFVVLFYILIKTVIRAWRKEGYNDAAKAILDVSRTPVGLMALADWNDPDDPFTVALDLGLDPMTGDPWDDGEPYEEPYFYDGDGL